MLERQPKVLPYVTAVVSSVIFGLSFLFTKRALRVSAPIELVAFRFFTAFSVMTVLIKVKLIKVGFKNKPIKWLGILAFFEPVMYFIFETYGVKNTSSSISGLMIALIPIAVTILAAYFLKEIPSIKRLIYIIISVSGVVLIVVMDNSNASSSSVTGILLLMGAVISAGFFNIISRKVSRTFTPVEITYFMMGFGALSFNLISIAMHAFNGNLQEYFTPLLSKVFIESIVYLGIISSICAYFLINFSLSKLEASTTSVFSNISTIVSILAGVIFLNEKFYYYHVIGSILILIGVIGVNLPENKKEKQLGKDFSEGDFK
ncbi:DMT family transporter [Clostridium neuense]|uniref:DMT family transporter n=1 Tax=Clostridium neuense TaxID=1728934 RepID=A0ABW8TCE4_9CLOT